MTQTLAPQAVNTEVSRVDFTHGGFDFQFRFDGRNFRVYFCHQDSDFWNWHYIALIDTIANSKIAAVTWVEQAKFKPCFGSLIRVYQLVEGCWVSELLGADGSFHERWHDNSRNVVKQALIAIAKQIRFSPDAV